jgi:hypothetical protein
MAYNKPGGSFRLATRPRNVEEITKAAQTYEYSALVPLRYWLRTAGTMLKEVKDPLNTFLFYADYLQRLRSTSGKAMTSKPTCYYSDMPTSSLPT